MPIATTSVANTGNTEDVRIMLLSEASKDYIAKKLSESIVLVIPDTGRAKFSGSHLIASGKQAGKDSKATFIVAELGSSFAGISVPYCQGEGDVKGLPLSLKLSITARPPNAAGVSIDEALNRPKTELKEVPKTGTNG